MNPIRQEYLDFATPAIAAGAFRTKNGNWAMPADPKGFYGAAEWLCKDNDIDPVLIDPPKTRTLKAIGKTLATTHRAPGDKDWQAMRALQYAMAMKGRDTKFQEFRHRAEREVKFDKAPDGSRRVREVLIDCDGWQEIPHWDFIATVTELHTAAERTASPINQGVFA